ncbi:MAG: hypothetical protein IPM36_10825 [Lewinellaceae bacterium]|nr:hypothetical protein [Lewinellaceae bacterium]
MHNIILCLLMCFSINSLAQKEDYNWITGAGQYDLPQSIYKNNHFKFYHDSLDLANLYEDIPFFGACAIVSDTSGQIAAYSNGINIYNRNHTILVNGDAFQSSDQFPFGYPFNQSVLLLPMPDTHSIYLMIDGNQIDIGIDVITQYLRYSIIDMSLDNGYGAVTEKKVILENTSDTLNIGFLNPIRHSNGKDWWLLVVKFESNQYRKFLLSKWIGVC